MNRVRARWVEFSGCRLCYTVVTHAGVKPLRVPSCARIVGALSAGAVIESGDNANGYYVRFADGTQICVMSEETTPAENSTQYGKQCTFPAAFYSTENLVLVASAGDMMSQSVHASTMTECHVLDASTYNVKMIIASDGGIGAPSVTWPFYACAIGRWKE